MPRGPGKYDDACTAARAATSAETVVLIVINGDKGNGFSVQSDRSDAGRWLPKLLREMAAQIEGSEN